jgi:hypothetical protein
VSATKLVRKVTLISACFCCRGLEHVNRNLQVVWGVLIAWCTVTGTTDTHSDYNSAGTFLCFIPPMSAPCPGRFTYLDVTTLITFGGEYKLSCWQFSAMKAETPCGPDVTLSFNITHLLSYMDTNLFPPNYTIHSFDAPTCFGYEQQPSSGSYSTWGHMLWYNTSNLTFKILLECYKYLQISAPSQTGEKSGTIRCLDTFYVTFNILLLLYFQYNFNNC